MTKIIPAAARTASPRGAKVLIVGPTGVGKTTLLRTLDPASTLFIDIEASDLAVQDVHVDTLQPRTWSECRDLAVALVGPNPAVPGNVCYSGEHFAAVKGQYDLEQLHRYQTIFVDSITAASRLCFAHSSQQPEAFTDRGKKDLRGAYGLHAREMLAWLLHLQQARTLNVVLVGILEAVVNEYGHTEQRLQMEGARTWRELPGIVDEVVTMNWINFGDGAPTRAFACTSPNKWNFPAKDRSGRLEQFEPPHLGKLLTKLSASPKDSGTVDLSAVQPQTESEVPNGHK
jgi:AAA domain